MNAQAPMGALPPETIVAVVGAGIMGAGIAQVATAAGHRVLLNDARPDAAAEAIGKIGDSLSKRVASGKMAEAARAALLANLSPAPDLDAVAGAGLVIEAIVENLDAKCELFASLEAVVGEDAILATNTSSVSVTAIGAKLARPQRLVGMHFFNPAQVMKLVEVVSGLATAPEVAEAVFATAKVWGKMPVHAKSTPGFIVNRVARPYYAEALRLAEEGAATPEVIDLLLTRGAGFPMGPFRLMDLIGNDTNYAVTRSTFDAYFGDPRYRPSILQGELVAAGRLGRKSGRGFYDYAQPEPPFEPAAPAAPTGEVIASGDLAAIAALVARLEARGVIVRVQSGAGEPRLQYGKADLRLTDGRPATLRVASRQDNLVVFDVADDFATVDALAVAVQDTAPPEVATDAIRLFAMAGIRAVQIDDTPGLVVARTLAMLANEAAEAELAGIATAEGIDQAMRFGVNYPHGPLEWADRLGAGCLLAILEGMHASYGDDRYRPSLRLRRVASAKGSFHETLAAERHGRGSSI